MNSTPGFLEVGSLYKLHTQREDHQAMVLECIRIYMDDPYSRYSALVRSIKTGWTMVVHGTNIYDDGSIDWDFSTNGRFTEKDSNGCLHQISYVKGVY